MLLIEISNFFPLPILVQWNFSIPKSDITKLWYEVRIIHSPANNYMYIFILYITKFMIQLTLNGLMEFVITRFHCNHSRSIHTMLTSFVSLADIMTIPFFLWILLGMEMKVRWTAMLLFRTLGEYPTILANVNSVTIPSVASLHSVCLLIMGNSLIPSFPGALSRFNSPSVRHILHLKSTYVILNSAYNALGGHLFF